MCQIIPFTLPCCRRVYVEVSKLPSCPDSWPKRKCPPELCIQVRGYEPEDRVSGACWRCKARMAGALGEEREDLRPGIDKAELVEGLEELNVSERRRIKEEAGECWLCGAKRNCKYCGATTVKAGDGDGEAKRQESVKKRERDTGRDKAKPLRKRMKVESEEPKPQIPTFGNPGPEDASHWTSMYPDPQLYDNSMGGFTYNNNATSLDVSQNMVSNYDFGAHPSTLGTWETETDGQSAGMTGLGDQRYNYMSRAVIAGSQSQQQLKREQTDAAFPPGPDLGIEPGQGVVPQQINFENFGVMDDAMLAHYLDAYNSQQQNVDYHVNPQGTLVEQASLPSQKSSARS